MSVGFSGVGHQRTPINLVGAGGHASVIADMASRPGITGLVLWSEEQPDLTRFPAGTLWRLLDELEATAPTILALGDLAKRGAMRGRFPVIGEAIIDASAIIGHGVRIGKGTVIMPLCCVNPNAVIESDCIVNTACVVEHDCIVGMNTHLSPGVRLTGGSVVGSNVHIGAGAIVLPGVNIGDGAVVGAGAVVIRDVPAGQRVVGVPAKPLGPSSDAKGRRT